MKHNFSFVHFKEIDSTNTEAARRIDESKEDSVFSLVISADYQKTGRGRGIKKFASIGQDSIYMSVIRKAERYSAFITFSAAIAVCEVLKKILSPEEASGLGIKWVNDIQLNGKKICGILVEQHGSGIIIGVGININISEDEKYISEDEVKQIAGGICINPMDIPELRMLLAESIIETYERLIADGVEEEARILEEYKALEITTGKRILVKKPGKKPVVARALSINNNGALKVSYENGTLENLTAGEVSIIQG